MSILTVVQKIAVRIGLTRPNTSVTSTDPLILQIVDLVEQECESLVSRHEWKALTKEATFTTVATESQGTVESISANYDRIINRTFWNRTLLRPVYGPMTIQEWAEAKASAATGPWNSYIIQGGEILFFTTPTAGETCAYYYISKYFVNLDGGGTSDSFAAEADTMAFPEKVVIAGGIWRWKRAKGLDYAEDYNEYERLVTDTISREGTNPVLSLSGGPESVVPGIMVPTGSWQIT